MACFIAPAVEAMAVTAIRHSCRKKEEAAARVAQVPHEGATFSQKLGWLTNLLWGGSFLLAIEHIWHGEVTLLPPFLTAMGSPAEVGAMLTELATAGVGMAALVTAVWGVMVLVYNAAHTRTLLTAKTPEGAPCA